LFNPFLEALGVVSSDLSPHLIEFRSLLAPLSAVIIAGLFSFYPAYVSASKPIVDGLKE
jgi:hypothetical protein